MKAKVRVYPIDLKQIEKIVMMVKIFALAALAALALTKAHGH